MTDNTIQRVLCPVDFSDPSGRALDYALDLAGALGAELHLLHAYQLPVYALPDGALIPSAELAASVSGDAQRAFDQLAARIPEGVNVQRHLTEGAPHLEVQRLVKELDIDLVIMGTHGRTGLARLLLGSVAERVVRTCPVPVLSVPPEEDS